MRGALLLMMVAAAAAQADVTLDDAARFFDAKQWAQAASAYQSIVDREPGNALALIRLARSRAANGETEPALAALEAWFGSGNGAYQVALSLPEFEALRSDARFQAITERYKPCNTPEFRHFDFWIGDWDVAAASAPRTVSRNRITLINDGCTLREEYTTPQGYVGTSLNFYDARSKRWHQTWIDNQGGALYLQGGLKGSEMVLETDSDPEQIQRITWTPLPDGRVRQHWQSTTDGGKTWSTAFDGHYTRRKPE